MKIGSVPYMNAKPLIHRLDREPGVELVFEVPSKLAAMLRNGDLAAGMVSSVACFQNPDLEIAPGMSISCIGPAESVKLFHTGRLDHIRTVALDTSSLTSVLLARIVLRERYDISPRFLDMPPSVPEMLEKCDGAVTIGDTTMRVEPGRWRELDLGAEWHALTGLPFVFAVWAVNPELASSELVDVLLRAKSRGLESIEEISESESKRLDLPVEVCHHYLGEIMDYDLTERHMEGLSLFREKARLLGYPVGDHELRLYRAGEGMIPA